MMYMFEFAVVC